MKAIAHLIQQDQPYDWAFKVDLDGVEPNSLRVLDFKVTESPSTLYQGVIHVASRNTKINPAQCIDRQVMLSVHHKYDASIRYFVGTLKSMAANDIVNGWAYYTLEMQPALFHLGLTSNARIFQQKTVPEIVKTILSEHGIVDYEFRVRDDHLPREYCVQYQETNLAFIERLLAEEGFYYFWEHSKFRAKWIVADHSILGTLMDSPEIEYNPDPSVALKGQSMWAMIRTESMNTTDLKQRDYCFKNPRYPQEHTLYQERSAGEPNVYEQYTPYGRYKDDNSGKRFTQYKLEAQRNAITQVTAHSNVPHLSAGHHINLQRHPKTSLNRSYQLLNITHTGTQPQATEARNDTQSADTRYYNALTLFPLDVHSWRASIPAKPVLNGPQIAHVVGPKDEEIFCDEHGRVKVQFPWDLEGQYDDQSSCWIRVSQGSAGAGWGTMSIPRVGQEVIVKFLEGDPDQPIIMGRLYDAVNRPPYALPQHKTRMTIKSKTHKGTGFNELRFEDKKGQEEVYLHAEKDFKRFIKNNEVVNIEGDLKVNVTQASEQRAKSVQITANDFIEFTLGNHHIKLTPTQITISGQNVSLKGQAMTIIKGGMVKINAGGGGGAQGKTNLEKMSVEPEVEEFGGFGINDSIEPIQVAGVGKLALGLGAIQAVSKAVLKGQKNKKDGEKVKAGKLKKHEVPCFKKNDKGKPKEYDRQLKDQENGLNDLTAEEYLKGREAYKSTKRKSTQKTRNDYKKDLIKDYQKLNMSKADATKKAESKMKTLHALHNPDLIAGGKDKTTTMGDKSVNQSIGSQWKKRVDDMDKEAQKAIKEKKGSSKMNVKLKRCK
ncbi:VgrG protein [hydrothermal vent metagenome]|uniref:VgrG protein n=1 Tax=hydrothermal vent metagenome TaxID=652676 RepID=A0A3B0WCJ8_9ZZZZ